MPKIVYQTMREGDYDLLIALWEASGLPFKAQGRDSKINIIGELANSNESFILAWDGNKLVGSILATHDGRKGWLNRLAVDPDYRKMGIGSQLIRQAEEFLLSAEINIFACLIEDWNLSSRELFQKNGYLCHDDIHYYTKRLQKEI